MKYLWIHEEIISQLDPPNRDAIDIENDNFIFGTEEELKERIKVGCTKSEDWYKFAELPWGKRETV